MNGGARILERAFALAEGGMAQSLDDIRQHLVQEVFSKADMHQLHGRTVNKELLGRIAAAKAAQKRKAPVPPKSTKLPRKLPDDRIARGVAIMREATKQDVGDVADKITRAPKKKR